MQTFLPYRDLECCVYCLDNRRLLAQINEAGQILKALKNPLGPWGNHCITRTWRGYDAALSSYLCLAKREAMARGLGNFTEESLRNLEVTYNSLPWTTSRSASHRPSLPEDFFKRYRQHLLAKDETHYRKFFPSLAPLSGYYALNKDYSAWQLYSEQTSKN